MKKLIDVGGVELETDEEKVGGLVKDYFGWREDRRSVEERNVEEQEEGEEEEGEFANRQGQIEKELLSGTSNASAPGPGRLIKTVMGTKLRKEIVREVGRNLLKGIIPKKWQNSKVVMMKEFKL